MILINKGETKKVYFTLSPSISPVYYLFKFISNDTGNVTLMMSDNLSSTTAYSAFMFIEGSTYSTAGGFTVNPGTYDYEIYQTPYNGVLNVASASGVLEIGLMTVLGGDFCYSPEIDQDYIYYDECSGPSVYGITGATGPQGPTGPPSDAGTSGTSGTSGMAGTSGIDGTSGTSGESGTSGVSGSSGTSGVNGANGSSGTSGINGSSGSSGANGANGSSGTSGVNGANGSSGTSGVNGANGSSGVSGSSGTSGVNGSSGSSGQNGSSGSSGTSGISGTNGTSGTSGAEGPAGISAGQTYYFNESQNSDVSGYKVLDITPSTASQQTVTTNLTGSQQGVMINDYITDQLGFAVIPGGTQRFHTHLLKPASNDNIEYYVEIQLADSSGTPIGPTLSSGKSLIGWVDAVTPVEVTVDLTLPTTTIDPTNRMIVRLYLDNNDATSHSVVYYTEGTSYYSFVLTSVGVVGSTSGTSGSSGVSGSSGTSGSSGINGANQAINFNTSKNSGTYSFTNVDTTGQMLGGNGGFYFTPQSTGDVHITILYSQGPMINTNQGAMRHSILYGTGSAPAQGATTTGISSEISLEVGIAQGGTTTWNTPINLTGIITGLQVGVQYWFDAAIANLLSINENPTINGLDLNIFELAGAIGATGSSGVNGTSGTSGVDGIGAVGLMKTVSSYNTTSSLTATTTNAMLGSGFTFEPSTVGNVYVEFSFNPSMEASHIAKLRYGTGTPPAAGDANTGTVVGPSSLVESGNSYERQFVGGVVSGLSTGVTYWFDLSLETFSGSHPITVEYIDITAIELAGAQGATGATGSGTSYTYISEDTTNKTLQLAITGSTIFDEIVLDPDQFAGNTRIKSVNVADTTQYSELISTYDNPSWSVITSTNNSSITLSNNTIISNVTDGTNISNASLDNFYASMYNTDGLTTGNIQASATDVTLNLSDGVGTYSEVAITLPSITNTSTDGTFTNTQTITSTTYDAIITNGLSSSSINQSLSLVSLLADDGINSHYLDVEATSITLYGDDVRVNNLSANVGDFVAIDTNGKLVATSSAGASVTNPINGAVLFSDGTSTGIAPRVDNNTTFLYRTLSGANTLLNVSASASTVNVRQIRTGAFVTSGTVLGANNWAANDASDVAYNQAQIRAIASENHGTNNGGTNLEFRAKPIGSVFNAAPVNYLVVGQTPGVVVSSPYGLAIEAFTSSVGQIVSVGATGALTTNNNIRLGSFGITIDGGGSAITTGVKGYVQIPYDGTITGWSIVSDVVGSCVIDVWKDTYSNFPPTVADTIAGSEKPTLSSAQRNQDLSLSTWTTSVSAGDFITFNVDSASTVTRVYLAINITKS